MSWLCLVYNRNLSLTFSQPKSLWLCFLSPAQLRRGGIEKLWAASVQPTSAQHSVVYLSVLIWAFLIKFLVFLWLFILLKQSNKQTNKQDQTNKQKQTKKPPKIY